MRGLAHIGVVQALSEAGIHPAFITGTSAGSLIGAMFAAGMDWNEMASLASATFWPKLLHGETLERFCAVHLPATFAGLKLPFAAVTTELPAGSDDDDHARRSCLRDQRELCASCDPSPGPARRQAVEGRRYRLRPTV